MIVFLKAKITKTKLDVVGPSKSGQYLTHLEGLTWGFIFFKCNCDKQHVICFNFF